MIPIGEFDNLQFRWDSFVKYVNLVKEQVESGIPHKLLAKYAIDNNLSQQDIIRLSFLYGMTYSSISTIQMFEELHPGLDENDWWDRNKSLLHFQNDKRYIKNMNQFVPALDSYWKNSSEIFEAVMTMPYEQARKVCLKKLRFFGEHALYLMYDVLQIVYGNEFGSLPNRIEWCTTGATVAEGMYRLLGWDEELPIKKKGINPVYISILDKHAETIGPIVGLNMTDLESELCAYAKLFKQTRYFGYYMDRHLGDLHEYEKAPKHIIDMNYKFRESNIDKKYLGEFNNWSGIRKEKCKEFVLYGTI